MNEYLLGGLIGGGITLAVVGVIAAVNKSLTGDELDLIDISRDEKELDVIEF